MDPVIRESVEKEIVSHALQKEMVENKEIVKYKQFTLDQFQIDAIHSIEKHNSVVVSAATGTGKTLIADYAINKFLNSNKRVVYTAPIKALSNQKYRDFKAEYGEDKVGIMTGDVVINPGGAVVIMTTEIYRNMLLTKDPMIDSISYVVFDEIHYMADEERGTVWEEAIIFSPKHIRFLCLSATIPNSKEFADWISSIKDHKVDVVTYGKRAVPLEHLLYDVDHGILTIGKAKELDTLNKLPDYYKIMRRMKKKKAGFDKPRAPKHYDLVKELKHEQLLPCIFFVFSRKGCEEHAQELAMKEDFLKPEEKVKVINYFNSMIKEEYKILESVGILKRVLQKGIGIHHAGILPLLKEIVENLFAQGLVKVLYATETFAVGINMPAKSVCFNSHVKFNGRTFNFMRSREYFQMAGRAGRRGIDTVGYAISLLERRSELSKIIHTLQADSEPIISQFRLEPNTVLNMINNHNEKEIDVILHSNFDYYQQKREDYSIRIKARYNNMVKKLKKLGYVSDANGFNMLTQKGRFATRIYSNEILVTEIFCSDIYKELSETEICVLVGAIIYEYRRSDEFAEMRNSKWRELISKVCYNKEVDALLNKKSIKDLWLIVTKWLSGCEFEELMTLSNYQEGDYIRFYRQIVDCMGQIKKAAENEDMQLDETITNCMNKIYRDVVRFEF